MRIRVGGLLLLLAANAQAEIRLGLINDFNGGNTQGWGNNIATGQPVASGGPDGSAFMRITSTGPQGNNPRCPGGANNSPQECGSKLAINNLTAAWTGDYLRSNVRSIQLQARNAGTNPAPLRMAFAKNHTSGGVWWITRNAVVLPPGGGWQTVAFSLAEADLVRTRSIETDGSVYSDAFANISVARILVNPAVEHRGEQRAHIIDVDNITALDTTPPRPELILNDGFEGF